MILFNLAGILFDLIEDARQLIIQFDKTYLLIRINKSSQNKRNGRVEKMSHQLNVAQSNRAVYSIFELNDELVRQ